MANTSHNIGIQVEQPKKSCEDDKCPFHGSIKVRGRQHKGTVVSTKMRRSAVVQWEHRYFIPKYERYELRFTKITVHAPDCMDIKEGDMVRVAETKPLSKTKHFTVIQNLGQERGYALKKESKEAGKVMKKEKGEETNEAG
jgi:small subunit ribosomal protein S17